MMKNRKKLFNKMTDLAISVGARADWFIDELELNASTSDEVRSRRNIAIMFGDIMDAFEELKDLVENEIEAELDEGLYDEAYLEFRVEASMEQEIALLSWDEVYRRYNAWNYLRELHDSYEWAES